MTHRFIKPEEKKPFRQDMREFHQAQKEREKKELKGTIEDPSRTTNPARGIPLEGAKRRGGSRKKKEESLDEDLIAGENIKEDDEEEETD